MSPRNIAPRPWLLLPIESNVRELDARVLVAAVAANRGFRAVLCRLEDQQHVLAAMPSCVTLNINLMQTEQYRSIRSAGHVVTALDEEGLVYRDEEEYLRRRVSADALRELERVFAWGEVHARVLRGAHPQVSDRVIASGNPRMDLLRPSFTRIYDRRVAELRAQLGDFVLVNSNFGTAHHRLGGEEVARNWRERGWLDGPEALERFHRVVRFQEALSEHFAELVEQLACAIGPRQIVVRPHPSENHTHWVRSLHHLSTVHVRNDGGVVPWILASSALIHNGCTTGIEAAILGRPALAYMPVRDPEVESSVPNDVSVQFEGMEEIIRATKCILERDPSSVPGGESLYGGRTLDRHVTNASGALASETIVEALLQVAPPPQPLPSVGPFAATVTARRARSRLRGLASATVRRRLGDERRTIQYYRDASPGFRAADIRTLLLQFGERSRGLAVVDLAPDVVLVESPDGTRRRGPSP